MTVVSIGRYRDPAPFESLSDTDVVDRVLAGEPELFELLMRRYNQRLYRVIRSILRRNEDDIEDVMQQAYVNAYTHLSQFAGRAQFSTWLTKIAVYEALARAKRMGRVVPLDEDSDGEVMMTSDTGPERQAFAGELRGIFEEAVEVLPAPYRIVFMMREVEGLSTHETAGSLGIREEAVKTRLHRAKTMLREELFQKVGATSAEAFTFPATRCDRIVERVFAAIAKLSETT